VRGSTGDIANTGTPEHGAPSIDPGAAKQGQDAVEQSKRSPTK